MSCLTFSTYQEEIGLKCLTFHMHYFDIIFSMRKSNKTKIQSYKPQIQKYFDLYTKEITKI